MLIINSKSEIKNFVTVLKNDRQTVIGFVPTMGALHSGHLSLISIAKKESDVVICSIYVNPLQFNNNEDFNKYPRIYEEDCDKLKSVGCDVVFIPDNSIIEDSSFFKYDIGYLDTIMEGLHRPGHFKGVAFIVKKLFELVKPDKSFFGEKDYQQLAVVKKMVKDFSLNLEIVGCPTIRETDGLALSSRNMRLNDDERKQASKIFEGLSFIKNNILSFDFLELKKRFVRIVEDNTVMKVEYVEICDAENLVVLKDVLQSKNMVVCTAVFLSHVRLIDNIKINL